MQMKPHWIALVLQLIISAQAQGETPSPLWSVDPRLPGADLPGTGASLFDLVTTDAQGYRQIPFPFERLLARIEAAAGCSEHAPCTRSVLIPLGRSLQRTAASPDFFAHPRIVTAAVATGRGPFMLRDRLYLGYQETAGQIEVISYNETLARFEFQLVKNYGGAAALEVVYAARTMCIACHQNQAPIFSRQVWLETNANPALAAKLEQQRAVFHGTAARTSIDTANAIDDATDRANLLALIQRLWRDGCGEKVAGDRCRVRAFLAALQYGLSGQRAYDKRSVEFQRDVVNTLARNAGSRWPSGIALPNPDIPNRDPLALEQQASGIALAHIPARFEPLLPRGPLDMLGPDGQELSDRLVTGLANFFSDDDFYALGHAIEGRTASAQRVEVPCSVETTKDGVQFNCAEQLAGTVGRAGGTVDTLAIGASGSLRHLQASTARYANVGASRSVSFSVRDGNRTARLPDGNAVQQIALNWNPVGAARPQHGAATITIVNDFAHAAEAVEAPAGPIRSAWIGELATKLRGEPISRLPSVVPEAHTDSLASQSPVEPALPFEAECGNCHHGEQSTPPNFLTGDAQRVGKALASCAPRIFVRLAMRDVPASQRDKTPMPPEFAVLPGETAETVKATPLAAARKSIENLLRREYGHVPTLDELLQHGYERLRPCLGNEPKQ
jgi:hypothetical protein